jgi:hypothetical protein
MAGAGVPVNREDLANLVRTWVHYDNLTTTLSKQTTNNRKIRDDFERKILDQLRVANMENAIIQIQGGRLMVEEEKHTSSLTMGRLTQGLHAYYAQKPGAVDETQAILKFLKGERTVEITKRLKKQGTMPELETK